MIGENNAKTKANKTLAFDTAKLRIRMRGFESIVFISSYCSPLPFVQDRGILWSFLPCGGQGPNVTLLFAVFSLVIAGEGAGVLVREVEPRPQK